MSTGALFEKNETNSIKKKKKLKSKEFNKNVNPHTTGTMFLVS